VEEMIDEELIEEEVVTRKPEMELPVTMLAKSSVEEMASQSEIAKKAVEGPEGPKTQADGLTVQALSRQLAELHRAGKYEDAVETAKRLLVQDPQHTVARRYIDEYHRQKQAALQAAMRRQQAEAAAEKAQGSATMSQTRLGAPAVIHEEAPEDAATAAPQAVSAQEQAPLDLIPDLNARPSVKMSPDQISWRAFDHRAGFFMSQVDGNTSYEDLIVISNMPREQALQILSQLVASGVIG
jgi:tetratricopeptide (TPR) repeat protein